MSATPCLQQLWADDLDALIAELARQGTTELVLLGPGVELPASGGQWPHQLRDKPIIYQLKEPVEDLAEQLGMLTQLTSLHLGGNQIGAEGAAALAALTQLTTLDLGYNQIGAGGAAALATLTQLTSLNLRGNQIGAEGAAALAALTQLTSLNLRDNQIGAEGAAALAAFTQLTSLDLGDNRIGAEGAAALAALTQLTSLELWDNQIGAEGAAALAALTELTSLDLGYNQIGDKGAAALAALTELTSLDLGYNQIGAEGAAALAALTQLTSLNLWDNQIGAEGAAALAALTELTTLVLGYNQIGDKGAAALAALTHLTSLNLRDNQIGAEGAAALAALTQLTSLNLRDNQIGAEGAAALAALTQLTSLNLRDNQIGAEGGAALAALTQLTSLNLRDNQIGAEGAAALAALTQLTTLELGGSQIGVEGAAALAALTQLTALDLGYNQIGDKGAAALAALTQLTSLNLTRNEIGDKGAAALAALTQLTTLDLSKNPVVETMPFATLKRLISLNLKETKVQDLSPLRPLLERGLEAKWAEHGSRNGINVFDCPLIHPPPEIVQQGQEAVLNYLREIDVQGADHLYEAKVLILGDGGAGKTSLLRRLYQTDLPLPAEEESTKGIDIHRHTFSNAGGRPFQLNVWDFGGQQIYHATHQFFLTKRSLYILVDDNRYSQAVQDDGFKYWLELIEALSEGSPVLIFQNEKAGRSKSIDEAGIKGRFPNVKDVYRGNLEQGDAAEKLAEAIRFHVQQLPHVGEAVPARWLAIRAELEDRKQQAPYVSRKEYFQIYGRHLDLDETKALQLSRYLHDLGVFLHFQEDPLLARLLILQNDWATEAVFNVLDDEPTKARFGYFTRADCQQIWAHSTYGDMHPELLALMEKFELCYKLADQQIETWLAPQLLSPSTPEALQDWPQADDLVLTYQYDFLPKGLISRLMVRMHRFVRQPDRSWRSGAYFEHGQSELLARLTSPGGKEIELRARGPERKALLSVISSDLDALNASFEGLRDKVRKFVPCICSQCRLSTSPERYEEGRLLKRKQDGKLTVECPESYEDVSVLELLDGLKLDAMPAWAKPAPPEPPAAQDRPSAAAAASESQPPRTIKVFLASSSELREDRDAIELHLLRKNNDNLGQQGIKLQILRWENFLDAMSETRLQDEYNEKARSCDIFLSLYKTKTGKFTKEEFNAAHAEFRAKGKPIVYTYFKNVQIDTASITEEINTLLAFKKRLSELGHYPTQYTSIEDLKLQFQAQLEQLIREERV